MKNKFPKIFLLAVICILVFPQVSFAAWWNPFTWKIFSRTPTAKVQETKQPSEIEKLRSEVEELKKKTATPAPSAVKPSVAVGDKSKATTKPVTPVAKPVVTATELKKQNPQEYKSLIDENKTKLLEASKLLSNKNIIARVKPSVVYIETASGSGSGIIVSADGYVLTNAHVVSGTDSATVKLANGESYKGDVVGRDENIDIALLKINGNRLSAALLGDSDLVEQGDPVFAFGYPLGIEGDVAFKDGTLSRRQKIDGTAYLEISAQILPGNSGGPLVNQSGEVIGINTLAIGALKVSGVLIGETLKYALPINTAKTLIPELKNGRNVLKPRPTTTEQIPQVPAPIQPPTQPYVPPPYTPPTPILPAQVQPKIIDIKIQGNSFLPFLEFYIYKNNTAGEPLSVKKVVLIQSGSIIDSDFEFISYNNNNNTFVNTPIINNRIEINYPPSHGNRISIKPKIKSSGFGKTFILSIESIEVELKPDEVQGNLKGSSLFPEYQVPDEAIPINGEIWYSSG